MIASRIAQVATSALAALMLAGIMAGSAFASTNSGPASSGSTSPGGKWLATIAKTNGGHLIGNPNAKLKLAEYVSYTCPHCAVFTAQSEAPLKETYIAPGHVNVEIRHLIRDPVDLTVALLVNCGPATKFLQNHEAFMLSQDEWIGPLTRSTSEQRARWTSGDKTARYRAIAKDFGFYAIMKKRGYSQTEADQCLADTAMAQRLANNSADDWEQPGITGTPSFSINGNVLAGTHTWRALESQLAARL